MKFLIVTFDFPPSIGGIENRIANYVKNMVQLGNEVVVIHLLEPTMLKKIFEYDENVLLMTEWEGTTIHRFPLSARYLVVLFFKILRIIENFNPDALHIASGANSLIGVLVLVYGQFKRLKRGISFYGKDILSSRYDLLRKLILWLSLLLAQKIGVNSKATCKLLPFFIGGKVSILYPGVDTHFLREIKIKKKPVKSILFVGRLVKRKGVDDLIKAFKLTLKEIQGIELVIVGDGPERIFLQKLVEKLRIKGKVQFTGFLEGFSLYEKYSDCDVFVMPSKQFVRDIEGFGMVFLEAALFKKPSVGTWSGGIPEAVIHGKTGILVKPGDVKALKDAIKLLLTNEDLARKLGENAHKRVISEFTWEEATKRFVKMYES